MYLKFEKTLYEDLFFSETVLFEKLEYIALLMFNAGRQMQRGKQPSFNVYSLKKK